MCATEFSYVIIKDKEGIERMILCKEKNYNKEKIIEVFKKAFPELFKKFWDKLIPERVITKIDVVGCRKLYSSQFDCQIYPWEKNNDWSKNPFVALWLIEENDKTFCGAKTVDI